MQTTENCYILRIATDTYTESDGTDFYISSQTICQKIYSKMGIKPAKQLLKSCFNMIIDSYDSLGMDYTVVGKNFKIKNGKLWFSIEVDDIEMGRFDVRGEIIQ